jgi:excisionase family DNA binding protein
LRTPRWIVSANFTRTARFRANLDRDARIDDVMKRTLMRKSETKKVLTVAEVAEMLRVHSTTIYRLVKRGELPGFKLGGNWRINRASLDLWLLAESPQHQSPGSNLQTDYSAVEGITRRGAGNL